MSNHNHESADEAPIVVYEGMTLSQEFFLLIRAAIVCVLTVGHFLLGKFTTLETVAGLSFVVIWMCISHMTHMEISVQNDDENEGR